MKWQGLSISRRPTDGRPRPNPGEESVRCNKVKTSRSILIKAIYTLKEFGNSKDTGHPVSQSDRSMDTGRITVTSCCTITTSYKHAINFGEMCYCYRLLLLAQCFMLYYVQTLLFIFYYFYSGVTPTAPLK